MAFVVYLHSTFLGGICYWCLVVFIVYPLSLVVFGGVCCIPAFLSGVFIGVCWYLVAFGDVCLLVRPQEDI